MSTRSGQGGNGATDAPLLSTGLVGIDGWLILPLLGLATWPLLFVHELVTIILPDFRPHIWGALTTPGSPVYSAYWAPYLVTTNALRVLLCAWAVALLVFFVRKSRRLPRLISMFFVAESAVALFRFFSAHYLSTHVPGGATISQDPPILLVLSFAATVVWILYFQRSVRVHNTFTR
jgi:hypothetical protein